MARDPQHHKIQIVLKGESASEEGEYAPHKQTTASQKVEYTLANATFAGPAKSIPKMDLHVGDTVTYSTDAVGVAKVRIVFPDCSPFREDHYKGTEVEVLVDPSGGGEP